MWPNNVFIPVSMVFPHGLRDKRVVQLLCDAVVYGPLREDVTLYVFYDDEVYRDYLDDDSVDSIRSITRHIQSQTGTRKVVLLSRDQMLKKLACSLVIDYDPERLLVLNAQVGCVRYQADDKTRVSNLLLIDGLTEYAFSGMVSLLKPPCALTRSACPEAAPVRQTRLFPATASRM